MTPNRVVKIVIGMLMMSGLSACGGTKISESCKEPQAYQAIVPSKRIVVPDDLDPLDDFKEIPLPKAETPPRPEDAHCLESTPSILSGEKVDT